MGITDRLRRLENGSRSSCATCGWPSNVTYDTVYVDSYETYQEVYENGLKFCGTCGHEILTPVWFHIEKKDTTLPVVICRSRRKEYAEDGD
jgi:hypothetical protein